MEIRFANREELERVNELRRVVNDLHVAGKPEIFKPGFCQNLRDLLYEIYDDPEKDVLVAAENGEILGFAILHHNVRPENPFMWERNLLEIDELAVDPAHRRRGVARAMVKFTQLLARERGISRVELNMWEFNTEALACYEALGFRTYRRYMELPAGEEEAPDV